MNNEHKIPTRLVLRLPAACPHPTIAIERWLLALWQIIPQPRFRLFWNSSPITLELLSTAEGVTYRIALIQPESIEITKALLPSYFPGLEVEPAEDISLPPGSSVMSARMELANDAWMEFAPEPTVDLAAGLIEAMAVGEDESILLQWHLKPTRLRWEKQSVPGFWLAGRLTTAASSRSGAVAIGRRIGAALGQHAGANRVGWNSFAPMKAHRVLERCTWPRRAIPAGRPCSPAQIAMLFHPPTHPAAVGGVEAFVAPRLSTPASGEGLLLGMGRGPGGRPADVRVPLKDQMRHMLVVGPSGSGKTTFLAQLAREAITSGAGVTVFDPHGGLAESIGRSLPEPAVKRAALLRLADQEHPIGINPFRAGDPFLAADDFVEVLRRTTSRSHWGPVLDLALRHVAIAMAETGGSLVEAVRLLEDEYYRRDMLAGLRNDATIRFLGSNARLQPALTRLQRLSASSWLRNILGQTNTTIDFGEVMDTSKVFLCDLSGLGLGASQLVGSLLLLLLRQAALRRRSDASPHLIILDEAALFLNSTVVELLDQARKYKVGMVLATQRLGQLEPESVRNALLANVGSTVAFRIHDRDEAHHLARRAAVEGFTPEALMRLPRFEAYAHLTVDGDRHQPAWLRVPPPPAEPPEAPAQLERLHASGLRYTCPRAKVEADLHARELALDAGEPEVIEIDALPDPFRANAA